MNKNILEKIILAQIDHAGRAIEILGSNSEPLSKQESIEVCEAMKIPYRVIRIDGDYIDLSGQPLCHGRINLEFENDRLVEITME